MRVAVIIVGLAGVTLLGAFVLGPRTPPPPLPPALVGSDRNWLEQAVALQRQRVVFAVIGLVLAPLVLWLVVRLGIAATARAWLTNHGVRNPWLLVAVYTTGLLVGLALLSTPLDYAGLLLRRAYGLSQESTWAWLGRQALSFGVGLVLALVATEGFFWVVRSIPRWWWLIGSVGYLVLIVGQVYLQPLVITPLFFKQTPLTDQTLRASIVELGNQLGVPIGEVWVIDASKQGNEGNAYFTGVGGSTRVVLYDTLIRNYPPDELLTILAHELGHWRQQHIWKGIALSALLAPFALGIVAFAGQRVLPRWGITGLSDPAVLPLLLLLATLGSTISMPAQYALSRQWEREADRIAVAATGDGAAFARTFVRLARQNLSNPTPPRLLEGLFATHPAVGRRVADALATIE